MFFTFILPAFVAAFGLFCSAQPLEERQSNGNPFSLYAYGEDINGLHVFYADGQAQIGDMSLSNASNKVPMYVTYSSNDRTTWIAHANTTQSTRTFAALGSSTTSTTNLLCLKESSSVTNPVTFNSINSVSISSADTETITNAWSLYGSTVLINRTGGNFYAKSTGKNGWWHLVWSTSDNAGLEATAIILRTTAPVLD
ncbi:hypothetical protein N7448_009614 [Penicillium atrosanguineum]|uniref:Uncharacterized protein n=1 Tax=Penicillium atrosanguineum TaxID=1132637 RepID=A0A9W9U6L5_9EURO|nr:uncharacterized protein N7443_006861 [Penicillium atrosanguineum]KAJ5123517.1 hypothetical protein N7448_009614 [Penicillium atrosanguineum]KAJ5142147.1 hypothetical protein N7526_003142 [Penicillium atrosanguineum]KAJ5298741.1 hypothetical protein N7443_006861 [Penicillium atrosanguineum]KAJ5320994.1 hypothetical protein N7476_003996 [Penicillium atrosanguineum]